jgi:hypothetical protein
VALRPTLSRGLPLSSDGAAGALGVGESKRCAKDRLPVVGAAEMGLRESVCCERGRVGLTYMAEKSEAFSPHLCHGALAPSYRITLVSSMVSGAALGLG